MAATIAFYKSPAGQNLLAATPLITSISADTLRKAGQDAGAKVGLKHAEEIERLKKQYESGMPATATPNKSTQSQ
jgi:hypothetical protein